MGDEAGALLPTKEFADKCAVSGRVACIQITYEDGEGL